MAEAEDDGLMLADIDTLSEKLLDTLQLGGYDSVYDVLEAGTEQLMELPGVGAKTAEKIVLLLEEASALDLEDRQEEETEE